MHTISPQESLAYCLHRRLETKADASINSLGQPKKQGQYRATRVFPRTRTSYKGQVARQRAVIFTAIDEAMYNEADLESYVRNRGK